MIFWDEKGLHFDVEKFRDNDISTVLQRWKDRAGDEEVDKTIADITVRWEKHVTKIGNDTALKIVS
jgi:putative transposon-encoded protein